MRPTSLLPIASGSSWSRASVSSTAPRTASGSASSCRFACRVSRSSGKPELASHLVQAEQAARLHVVLALAKVSKRFFVLEDTECLLDRVPFLRRDDDGRRPSFAGDDEMLMPRLDVVGEHQPQSIDDVLARFLARPTLAQGARDLDDAGDDPALLVGLFVGDGHLEMLAHGLKTARGSTAVKTRLAGIGAFPVGFAKSVPQTGFELGSRGIWPRLPFVRSLAVREGAAGGQAREARFVCCAKRERVAAG